MSNNFTLSGAWQLAGQTVAVMVAGLDAGNYTVAIDGTITVPFGSDPDGLLTPAYLNAVSNSLSTNPALTTFTITNGVDTITVYVPVLIGYPYTSVGQELRPNGEAQAKTPTGGALGKTRRTHMASILFQGAQGVSLGTTTTNLDPIQFADKGSNLLTHDTLFSGVWEQPIEDDYSFDGMLMWQITRPYPCTVVSANSFIETQER